MVTELVSENGMGRHNGSGEQKWKMKSVRKYRKWLQDNREC